jgi:hypothetical protein
VASIGAGPGLGTNTRFVRYLGFRNVNLPVLTQRVLAAHQHLLAIQISGTYYENQNVSASPLPTG